MGFFAKIEFQSTPKTELFVTLLDAWRPQTKNTTKTFILHIAIDLYVPLKQLLGWIEDIKIQLVFLMIWVTSLIWTFAKSDYQ